MKKRIEKDALGEVGVPEKAYWGPSTQRSLENFRISGLTLPHRFIKALGIVKLACAKSNLELGRISEKVADSIIKASKEVVDGRLDSQFPVDVFQTGSGTHSNMNMNEVIANRAAEILGEKMGLGSVHPNDHVNLSQSSNDVVPTAMHISTVEALEKSLIPSLKVLVNTLNSKSEEFKDIVKTGRTHLMDATPITLGQEFATYAAQVKGGIERLKCTYPRLLELPIGGTAVGTGVNAPKGFSTLTVKNISRITGFKFEENPNKAEGIAAHDTIVEVSGALKTLAVSLSKIANDIRWLSSGPGAGFNEISIPSNEPGSSIMPGKVNPTQAEALLMVCAQIIGNDVTITFAGAGGNFELNTMKPVMVYNILQSIEILANSVDSFSKRCVRGITANEDRIEKYLKRNLMLVTALTPIIGYDMSAEITKKAILTGKGIRELALEMKLLPEAELNKLLDPKNMLNSK